jgi:MioC protein
MANSLTILVASMTGTAELVAEEVRDRLSPSGIEVEILPMDGLDPSVFQREGAFLICSSTYGNGDVPDNGRALYNALGEQRPDLSHVRYGVIGLGDRTYSQTFCFGGKRFDELLTSLGAKRVGEPLFHDASAGTLPEEVAAEWAVPWASECFALEAAA